MKLEKLYKEPAEEEEEEKSREAVQNKEKLGQDLLNIKAVL